MQEERHPQGHPETQAQARSDLFGLAVCETRFHDDAGSIRRSGLVTLGVEGSHVLAGVVDGEKLGAQHGCVVATELARDQPREDHDQTQCDDGGQVEYGSQHPRAMLIDLETLDVVVRHADTGRRDDCEQADSGLGRQCAAESSSNDDHCSDVAHEGEDDDEVTVDAVDDEVLVSYNG